MTTNLKEPQKPVLASFERMIPEQPVDLSISYNEEMMLLVRNGRAIALTIEDPSLATTLVTETRRETTDDN